MSYLRNLLWIPRRLVDQELVDLEGMQIFVRGPTTKTVVVNVEGDSLIEDVRIKLMEKTGIPPRFQCLTYTSKILEDGHTLFSYNIQKEATLHLASRINEHACGFKGHLNEAGLSSYHSTEEGNHTGVQRR